MTGQDERAGYIAGLRQLADALEAHPELPLPYDGTTGALTMQFLHDDPRAAMAAAARALPCQLDKVINNYDDMPQGGYLYLRGKLAGLRVELVTYRDAVCTIAGYEDREVNEVVTPAVVKKVTKPMPVWECAPVLAPRPAAKDGAR